MFLSEEGVGQKGAQTNSGKSATRNLESERIRCRAESTGWGGEGGGEGEGVVNLQTVT